MEMHSALPVKEGRHGEVIVVLELGLKWCQGARG